MRDPGNSRFLIYATGFMVVTAPQSLRKETSREEKLGFGTWITLEHVEWRSP